MVATFVAPTAAIIAGVALAYAVNELYHCIDAREKAEVVEEDEKDKEKFKFPENLDDLLPDLPRDGKGQIQTADNLRIRPEKHPMEEGETYNSRHLGQHYHVETRRDPAKSWEKKGNAKKLEPNGYNKGDGTGFLPGENYPGII